VERLPTNPKTPEQTHPLLQLRQQHPLLKFFFIIFYFFSPNSKIYSIQLTTTMFQQPIYPKANALCCPAGITCATLSVCIPGGNQDTPHARPPALNGLTKHSPALRELRLLLSGRSAYTAVTEAMGDLEKFGSLQELTLQFVVSSTPKKGMWPMFFSDNIAVGKLRQLAVEGTSMPPLAVTVSGSCFACRKLLAGLCLQDCRCNSVGGQEQVVQLGRAAGQRQLNATQQAADAISDRNQILCIYMLTICQSTFS
jgi:hypothetical protein